MLIKGGPIAKCFTFMLFYKCAKFHASIIKGTIVTHICSTMRDYTHFAMAESEFSNAVDKQLIETAKISTCLEWKKHVHCAHG